MKCSKCGHTMQESTVSVGLCDLEPAAVIRGVPAFVCPNCGNRLYSAATMERLDEIRDGFGKPESLERLEVYNFTPVSTKATTTHGRIKPRAAASG